MPLNFTNAPRPKIEDVTSPPEAPELPRQGRHLNAIPEERKTVYGYQGKLSGPLCNTGDGHASATPIGFKVTCPHCLDRMHRRLGLEITAEQRRIVKEAREAATE